MQHVQEGLQNRGAARPIGSAFASTGLGGTLVAMTQTGPASSRTLADHLVRNPVLGATSSMEELAAATGVSTATVSRFARRAGHGTYAEFRQALAQALRSALDPVEKLKAAQRRGMPGGGPLRAGLQATLANAQQCADGLSDALVGGAVAALLGARVVYVMGFGLSSHAAGLLALGIQPFCGHLVNVVEFGGTELAAGRLMNIGPRDALAVISVPRYSASAVRLTEHGRSRGAAIVAVTDSPASPLAGLADHTLLAPCGHPVMPNSMAAVIMAVEALTTAVMTARRGNVAKAAALADAISHCILPAGAAGLSRPAGARRPRDGGDAVGQPNAPGPTDAPA